MSVDSRVLALKGVTLVDGVSLGWKDNQTILIQDGKITAVGETVSIPSNARELDLQGRTVMPGLVMLHEHLMYFSGRAVWHAQPVSYPKLYLAAGVTTTSNGAELLGVGGSVGRIAPGYAADLLLVNGNPAQEIAALENIEIVFKDGLGYDPVKLGLVGWH